MGRVSGTCCSTYANVSTRNTAKVLAAFGTRLEDDSAAIIFLHTRLTGMCTQGDPSSWLCTLTTASCYRQRHNFARAVPCYRLAAYYCGACRRRHNQEFRFGWCSPRCAPMFSYACPAELIYSALRLVSLCCRSQSVAVTFYWYQVAAY